MNYLIEEAYHLSTSSLFPDEVVVVPFSEGAGTTGATVSELISEVVSALSMPSSPSGTWS